MNMNAVIKTDIDRMIAGYRDGYSLEQPFYLSPDIFTHDMERLLFRRWLLVDHESRIPNKGDYFLFNIANESIIIIRESGNRINAFFQRLPASRLARVPGTVRATRGCSPAPITPGRTT